MKLKDLIIRLLAMDQELEVFSYDDEGDDTAAIKGGSVEIVMDGRGKRHLIIR